MHIEEVPVTDCMDVMSENKSDELEFVLLTNIDDRNKKSDKFYVNVKVCNRNMKF